MPAGLLLVVALVLLASAAIGAADLVRARVTAPSLYAHATVFFSAALAASDQRAVAVRGHPELAG